MSALTRRTVRTLTAAAVQRTQATLTATGQGR